MIAKTLYYYKNEEHQLERAIELLQRYGLKYECKERTQVTATIMAEHAIDVYCDDANEQERIAVRAYAIWWVASKDWTNEEADRYVPKT